MLMFHRVLQESRKGICIRIFRVLRGLRGFTISFELEGRCWDSGFI